MSRKSVTVQSAKSMEIVQWIEAERLTRERLDPDPPVRACTQILYRYIGAGGLGALGFPGANNGDSGIVVFALGRGREGQIDLSKCPR